MYMCTNRVEESFLMEAPSRAAVKLRHDSWEEHELKEPLAPLPYPAWIHRETEGECGS